VLEARDRIGGRVYTHDSVELGAEFIHGKHRSVASDRRTRSSQALCRFKSDTGTFARESSPPQTSSGQTSNT
jgi:hypothetical protein